MTTTTNERAHAPRRPAAAPPTRHARALAKLCEEQNEVYSALMDTDRPTAEPLDSWDVRELESGESTRDVERRRREHLFVRLRRIDAALARAEAGTYGRCLECDDPIPAKRLDLDPAAQLCVACQARVEGDLSLPSL